MELLQTIVVAVVTLGILVAFHEYGHFWVARRMGVRVLRFSVGFGQPLLRTRDRSGTEYTIGAIPLGGYVRMVDEREGDVSPEDRPYAFNRKSVWARIAIVAAGPVANFLLAIAVFWFLFLRGESGLMPVIESVAEGSPAYFAGLEPGQEIVSIDGRKTPTVSALNFRLLDRLGETGAIRIGVRYPNSDVVYESEAQLERWLADQESPNPVAGLGVTIDMPALLPVVASVTADGPAAASGFVAGDRILRANGDPMPLWEDWVNFVQARPGERLSVDVERDGSVVTLALTPEAKLIDGARRGSVGMVVEVPPLPPERIRVFERGPVEALGAAVERTGDLIVFTFESMAKMVQGLISPKNLSGPITIAQVAASSAESGFASWLGFLALLSISLGTLNLLPIPVLDGGHLAYYAVEVLIGRPVPERIQMAGYQIGTALVFTLMAFALYNDMVRL